MTITLSLVKALRIIEARMWSQSVIASATASKRHVRILPHVFTEHGAIMATHVLSSWRVRHLAPRVQPLGGIRAQKLHGGGHDQLGLSRRPGLIGFLPDETEKADAKDRAKR